MQSCSAGVALFCPAWNYYYMRSSTEVGSVIVINRKELWCPCLDAVLQQTLPAKNFNCRFPAQDLTNILYG